MVDAGDEGAEPRWLDEVELVAWLRFIPLLTRLPLELDRQLQRDSGLTFVEYGILAGLSEAPGRSMRMSTIGTWIGAQLPRLSQVTGRMESRGWLVRSPDPADGRVTLATLTDEGMAVLVAAAPDHVANVRRLIIDSLTRAQLLQLGEISTRVMQVISPGEPILPRRGH
jgi:DNA-binding MarR family transcriptional regulator